MLNNKALTFLKNFSYTLSSNFLSLFISTLVILIVPKLIGVEDYGYWQLYLFYTSYVGFLHFGWNDGIYLRYGGEEYRKLDKKLFFSQFWMLFILQLLFGIVVLVFSTYVNDLNRSFIILMTAVCMIIVNVRFMLVYILQGTNRMKEFAQITIIERVLYCALILLFLAVGVSEFKVLIFADIAGKLVALMYSIYCCKDIVFKRFSEFYFNFKETFENITVGIKLMFSNIASMLIIGIERFGIERNWDVSTFGKVSLTMSISNLMMVFIDAVGIIMFPVLRRTNQHNLSKIYSTMRTALMTPLMGLLVVYYPIKLILQGWLPQFYESLMYMALLFPLCVYEGKMSLLINTYLKTLRKEKLMLNINLTSVVFSIILTVIFTQIFNNLSLAIVSIVILLAFRCVLAEMFLAKILNISVKKDILLEMTMTAIFILTGWFISSWIGIAVYLTAYGLYLLIKKQDVINAFINIKHFAKG